MTPLLLLLLPALLAAAAAADCKSLDLRVESASRDTATVSLAPPPETKKIRFEYSTGKFPTVDEVWVQDSGNAKREHYVMTDLDPGTEYSLRVTPECSESVPCKARPSPPRSSLLGTAYLPPLHTPQSPSPPSPPLSPLWLPSLALPSLSPHIIAIYPLNLSSFIPETTQVVQT